MAEGDDIPVEQLKALEVSGNDDETPGYKAPAKVDLETLKNMDAEDESLNKYKASLLAQDTLDEGGPNVLLQKLVICFDEKEDIMLDLTDLDNLPNIAMKEGCTYRLKILFRVQRDIVSGLKFHNVISRKDIRVDKSNYMVGSYGPKKEVQSYTTPPDIAPAGMIARGKYKVKSKFVDDDGDSILEWTWNFSIHKDWK